MSAYRRALQSFRSRYLLGAVLDADGNVTRAAEAIGMTPNWIWTTLRDAGFPRSRVREMLLDRARLQAGQPPMDATKKPVRSVSAAEAMRRIA